MFDVKCNNIHLISAMQEISTTEKVTTRSATVSSQSTVTNSTINQILIAASQEQKYEKPVPVVYPPEEAEHAQAIGIPSLCLLLFEFVSIFILDLTSIIRQARDAKEIVYDYIKRKQSVTEPMMTFN